MLTSESNTTKDNPETFPCLREYLGSVLLTYSRNGDNIKGTIVKSGHASHPLGYYYEAWAAHIWKPFRGSITLTEA